MLVYNESRGQLRDMLIRGCWTEKTFDIMWMYIDSIGIRLTVCEGIWFSLTLRISIKSVQMRFWSEMIWSVHMAQILQNTQSIYDSSVLCPFTPLCHVTYTCTTVLQRLWHLSATVSFMHLKLTRNLFHINPITSN